MGEPRFRAGENVTATIAGKSHDAVVVADCGDPSYVNERSYRIHVTDSVGEYMFPIAESGLAKKQ